MKTRCGACGRLQLGGRLHAPPPSHPSPSPARALPPQSEALAQLQDKGFEQAERGSALLGYVVAGPCAGVLLATRSKQKAMLPGGHTVYVVTDSQWVIVPLLVSAARLAGRHAPQPKCQPLSPCRVPVTPGPCPLCSPAERGC
jgi:hypothetical protein